MYFSPLCDSFLPLLLAGGKENFSEYLLVQPILSHWVGPHPDNVVHIYIISEEIIFSCFYIYYTCISGVRMTEEVEE